MKLLKLHIPLRALFYLFSTTALLLYTGCKEDVISHSTSAFIGGEIINPNSRYLVLSRNEKVLDTIPLDNKNRFSYRIDSVQPGQYLIQHRPETQNIYLAPGDSLLLRVNTLAFDESLHFSGRGDERNNFMAEMFLQDESNADLLLSYYKIEPSEFAEKTDSILKERIKSLEKADQKREFSDDFTELAHKTINYESYDLRERYLYLIKKYFPEFTAKIPKDFYSYRDKVDFNEAELQSSPGYKRFIDNYLINFSLDWCAQSNLDDTDCFDLTSTENISSRLEKASELIQLPTLRHYFLTKLGVLGIVMAHKREEIVDILDLLEEEGYPEKDLEDMKQLGNIQLAYLPGTQLRNLPLLNSSGEEVEFEKVVDMPTIIFLWSLYSKDHEENHEIVQGLRKKYPEINFIGINTDIGETQAWKNILNRFGYDQSKEFQLGNTRIKKEFFQYYLNKLLFLDASGKVIIGDAFINSPEFENRILEFLNK